MMENYEFSVRSVAARLFSILVAMVLFSPGPALAAAELLTGKSEWKVAKIGEKDAAYCAMTRKFARDAVLTLGAKGNGEFSLAFDFQKNTLTPEKGYLVALEAGSAFKRAFEARPASATALVLGIGRDADMLDSFTKSKNLTVNLDGKLYVFDLGGFTKKRGAFDTCVASLGEKSVQPLAQAASDSPGLKPESLLRAEASSGQEISASRGEAPGIEALREENLRLSNALAQERRSYEDRQMAGSESSLVAELREKIALLESRLGGKADKVPAKAAESPKAEESNARIAQLGSENKALKAEIERLGEQIKASASNIVTPKAFEDLRARLEKLDRENESLRKQIAQNDLSAADTAADDVESVTRLRALELETEESGKKISALEKENEALREEKEKKLLRAASEDWNLEEATRRYNEAEREIRRMALLVEENKGLCAREKIELEGMLFDPSVADQAQLSRLSALENRLRTAQAELQSQREAHERETEELRRAAANANPEDLAGREEKIKTLESDIGTIRADLEKALKERDLEREKTLGLSKEVETLKAQLASGGEMSRQTLARLEAEKNALAADLERLRSERSLAESKASGIGEETARLRAEKAAALAERDRAREDKENLAAELDRTVRAQNASRTPAEKAVIGKEIMALRAELARLEQEKSRMATALLQARQQKPAAESPAQQTPPPALSREIESLRAEIRSSREAHESELAALRKSLAQKESAPPARIARSAAPDFSAERLAAIEPAAGPGAAAIPLAPPATGSGAAVHSVSLPSPAPVQSQPIAAPAAASASFMTLPQISGLIEGSGIRLSRPVERLQEVSGPTFSAFRWQTGPTFGSSEQSPIGDTAQFDRHVDAYIEKTRSRCQGDFAASPASATGEGGKRVSSYEIACIGSGGASSAAIVFFVRNGLFTVVAHESGTDSMDVAMENRDRIFAALAGDARTSAR